MQNFAQWTQPDFLCELAVPSDWPPAAYVATDGDITVTDKKNFISPESLLNWEPARLFGSPRKCGAQFNGDAARSPAPRSSQSIKNLHPYSARPLPVLNGRLARISTTIGRMQRTRHNVFAKATTPRYVVVWSIHWQVIECQRLEPATDLCAAMAATIERLHVEGWEADGSAEHGFVFIRRSDERRGACPHDAAHRVNPRQFFAGLLQQSADKSPKD